MTTELYIFIILFLLGWAAFHYLRRQIRKYRQTKSLSNAKEALLLSTITSLFYALEIIIHDLSYLENIGIDCPEKKAYEFAKRVKGNVNKALAQTGERIKYPDAKKPL